MMFGGQELKRTLIEEVAVYFVHELQCAYTVLDIYKWNMIVF